MARLLTPPQLTWREDGTPVASAHDDVYFSVADGLEETRAVFLQACDLPDAWRGRELYTVAETGFGTGLNFLALWQAWQMARPSLSAQMHFVSFEAFPLPKTAAAQALAMWPELSDVAEQLLRHWPGPVRGVRQISWPEAGVTLTLHLGDIQEMLPQAQFTADAWFLDGFSPAKNADMWGEWIYPQIAARCTEGARLGTFTVAGAVRRGLAEAGFSVERVPGHGRKRQRLEAQFCPAETGAEMPKKFDPYAIMPGPYPAKRVAVIGAGIAGASAAHALANQGAEVEVYEAANGPATKASGNPLALLMPRLDVGDTVQARVLIDAYLAARTLYAGQEGAEWCDIHQPAKDETARQRHGKLLADPPLQLEDLEAVREAGLLHKRGMVLRPAVLCESLLGALPVHYGTLKGHFATFRDHFDAIVIAAGMQTQSLLPWLGLIAKQGQVDFLTGEGHAPASAIASGSYALASDDVRLWGATFEGVADEAKPVVSEGARAENLAALETLSPYWMRAAKAGNVQSRAGLRATTADRMPLIGVLPDEAAAREVFDGMRTGRKVAADAPREEGVYLSTGFGARGFTFGPWAGQILAAQILGHPAPAPQAALEAVSPMRLILRRLKRGG